MHTIIKKSNRTFDVVFSGYHCSYTIKNFDSFYDAIQAVAYLNSGLVATPPMCLNKEKDE